MSSKVSNYKASLNDKGSNKNIQKNRNVDILDKSFFGKSWDLLFKPFLGKISSKFTSNDHKKQKIVSDFSISIHENDQAIKKIIGDEDLTYILSDKRYNKKLKNIDTDELIKLYARRSTLHRAQVDVYNDGGFIGSVNSIIFGSVASVIPGLAFVSAASSFAALRLSQKASNESTKMKKFEDLALNLRKFQIKQGMEDNGIGLSDVIQKLAKKRLSEIDKQCDVLVGNNFVSSFMAAKNLTSKSLAISDDSKSNILGNLKLYQDFVLQMEGTSSEFKKNLRLVKELNDYYDINDDKDSYSPADKLAAQVRKIIRESVHNVSPAALEKIANNDDVDAINRVSNTKINWAGYIKKKIGFGSNTETIYEKVFSAIASDEFPLIKSDDFKKDSDIRSELYIVIKNEILNAFLQSCEDKKKKMASGTKIFAGLSFASSVSSGIASVVTAVHAGSAIAGAKLFVMPFVLTVMIPVLSTISLGSAAKVYFNNQKLRHLSDTSDRMITRIFNLFDDMKAEKERKEGFSQEVALDKYSDKEKKVGVGSHDIDKNSRDTETSALNAETDKILHILQRKEKVMESTQTAADKYHQYVVEAKQLSQEAEQLAVDTKEASAEARKKFAVAKRMVDHALNKEAGAKKKAMLAKSEGGYALALEEKRGESKDNPEAAVRAAA
jgi:hypothetical protein